MSFFVGSDNDLVYKEKVELVCKHCHKRFNKFKGELERFEDTLKLDDVIESVTSDGMIIHHSCSSQLVRCDVCTSTFSSIHKLELHRQLKDRPFSCDTCCRAFTTLYYLEQHKRSCHVKPIEVEDVSKAAEPYRHLYVESPTGFRCSVCNHIFVSQHNLDAHRKLTLKKLCCDTCSQAFASCSLLEEHKASCYVKPIKVEDVSKAAEPCRHPSVESSTGFRCHVCNHIFVSQRNLDAHRKLTLKLLGCDTCSQAFPSCLLLGEHKRTCVVKPKIPEVAPENGRQHSPAFVSGSEFYCNKCMTTFPRKSDWDEHLELGKLPFRCDKCCLVFASRLHSEQHKKKHARAMSSKGSIIDKSKEQSDQTCVVKSKIPEVASENDRQHSPAYVSGSEFHCNKCMTTFPRKSDLDEHLELRNLPFSCDKCCLVFASSLHLEQHKKKHSSAISSKNSIIDKSKEQPVQTCGMQPEVTEVASRHSPVSGSEFRCRKCMTAYPLKSDLDAHLLLKLPFTCDKCCLGFDDPVYLEQHLMEHMSAMFTKNSIADKSTEQPAQVESKTSN